VNVWLSCELEPNKNIEISIFVNVLKKKVSFLVFFLTLKFKNKKYNIR